MPSPWRRAPAALVAREIARAHLVDARAAARRLVKGGDAEALHDFRVALRRLRSTVRAYRPYLDDTVTKGMRKRLRTIARATGAVRDAEVQRVWLASLPAARDADERHARDWLDGYFARSYVAKYRKIPSVLERFTELDLRLRVALRLKKARGECSASNLYAHATGNRLCDYATELCDQLEKINAPDDHAALHAARVTGKRARYLIEPLGSVARLPKTMKHFQDRMGTLCDALVRRGELVRAIEVATSEQPVGGPKVDPRPGLLGLVRRTESEIGTIYRDLDRDYFGVHARTFVAPVVALGERLRRHSQRGQRALQSNQRMLIPIKPSHPLPRPPGHQRPDDG